MSDLTLKMLLLGEDRTASKALKNVGDESDKTSNKLATIGKVAAIGFGAVAVGVGAIFKTGIDEQKDFLSGQAQLAAGVKSTGGAAGVTVDHMEDLASSIQNYSGQTDDSIVASEQLLLTFTGIKNVAGKNNDIFDQTVKISADMAAKMGGDASASAIQLGKALNDPVAGITALTRVGVSFTQQQKDQIAAMVKSGDTIGAQKVILKELNTEFGGSAKAAGDTLPGQLARARRSFEDVSQSVVAALMPGLAKLGDLLTEHVVPAFSAAVAWVVAHWPAVQAVIVSVFQEYVLPVAMTVVDFFRTRLIPAAEAVIGYVVSHWPQIQKVFVLFWQTVKPLLEALGRLFLTLWHTIIEPLVNWVKQHWSQIQIALEIVAIAIGIIFKVLAVAITIAVNLITDIIKFAVPFIVAQINAVIAIFHAIADVVMWLYNNVWKPQFDLIVAVISGVVAAAKNVYSGVTEAFGNVVSFITGLPGKIASAASGMWDGIKDAFRAAINWILHGWNSLHFKMPSFDTHIPGVGTVGGFDLGLPQIPYLAAGGIVTKPTLAMIGEAGSEAVIPLNRANKAGFGGDLHVTVNARSNEPRDIANAVVDAVRKHGMTLPIASGIR